MNDPVSWMINYKNTYPLTIDIQHDNGTVETIPNRSTPAEVCVLIGAFVIWAIGMYVFYRIMI